MCIITSNGKEVMNLKESKEGIKKRKMEPLLSMSLRGGPLNTAWAACSDLHAPQRYSIGCALDIGPYLCVTKSIHLHLSTDRFFGTLAPMAHCRPCRCIFSESATNALLFTCLGTLKVHVKSPCSTTQSEHHTDFVSPDSNLCF